VGELLRRTDVDTVYIATPPFLHHGQAMAALEAGKHVIVEKPLALTVAQADELVAAARRRDRLLVANLMQRYNPLFDAVRRLVEARALGEVLHGSFENYASDENLPAGHWFWDRGKSGGIFVEHGVHFFDLFAGWLGPGRVEAAQAGVRPGTSIEEHVQATVRYGDAALVNFYHGFHQAGRMDRQELRLVFERGDVTLFDWVPTRARIHALVDERQTRDLGDLFPGARLDVAAPYGGNDRACRGRGKPIDAYQVIDLSFGDGQAKSPLYGRLLRSMMEDQAAWIRDRSHRRVVTEANGRDSLATACEADALAHRAGADR
jgi:predicted dehydrogenase